MKISYYPGCTLKSKARNLEEAGLAALSAFGVEAVELPRWNCCGAVHSLSDDDLIHHVAPVRDLVRVLDAGHTRVMTLCSMCYNTLARANRIMREDEVKRRTINEFMSEERDYHGEVEVVHFLTLVRDEIGWERVSREIKVPLSGLRVAPYYGCTLVRPREVSIEVPGTRKVFTELIEALGASPVDFPWDSLCCGSYQVLANPGAALEVGSMIIGGAEQAGAEALVLSCPLCEYNLGRKQGEMEALGKIAAPLPTYYFTQLLAVALGLGEDVCRFDLNDRVSAEYLHRRGLPGCAPAA